MAGPEPVVDVIGARALRRDLQRLGEAGGAILEEIKVAGRTAAEPVVTKARSAWPISDLAHAHHADSLRVIGVKTGATVAEGGRRYGGTGWLEFGGNRGRDYIPAGRFLFPAAAGLAPVVAELYSAGVQKALDLGSSWTNTTSEAKAVSE